MSVSTPAKVGAFAVALAVGFVAAFGIGAAASPVIDATPTTSPDHEMSTGTIDSLQGHGSAGSDAGGELPGLAVSAAGYTLVPAAAEYGTGPSVPFAFTITGPDGHPVTGGYAVSHEKELHLIVVRRDLSGFQHVHPTRDAGGVWTVPLNLATAGSWRVFADFTTSAQERSITLGADIAVSGSFQPVPLPAAARSAEVDGYQVSLSGTPSVAAPTEVAFGISRDGRPVSDLEPYLGAFGHLVTLRTGDLAYLHTHPGEDAHQGELGGPTVAFSTAFPTAGSYRLFLDFQHGGSVHTAEFTVVVGDSGH